MSMASWLSFSPRGTARRAGAKDRPPSSGIAAEACEPQAVHLYRSSAAGLQERLLAAADSFEPLKSTASTVIGVHASLRN